MFLFAESLAQYRRTLCRKPKETEAANEARKKRSRKQRVSSFLSTCMCML